VAETQTGREQARAAAASQAVADAVAALSALPRWRVVRRAVAAEGVLDAVLEALGASLELARAAEHRASLAARWARLELASPRQHAREAAASLLEALGEPVTLPPGSVLIGDLAMVVPPDAPAVAWDDLARLLKDAFPSSYPVVTGAQLRSAARAAGAAETEVRSGGTRRLGVSGAELDRVWRGLREQEQP
jgi:hypothetical protein